MNTNMKTKMCMALFAATFSLSSAAIAQQAYPTPEAASAALVDALGRSKSDQAKLASLLGSDWKDYVPVGGVDRKDVDAFLEKYRERHSFKVRKDGHQELVVGEDSWTLPIPMAKVADGWRFDLAIGKEEIRTRRIGRNELDLLQTVRAYHDAQMDYAEVDHDADGVLEYAQQFVSTDGKHDGLFWAEDDSGQVSPIGPAFGDDTPDGIYNGYRYRILKSQGVSAPGGARDFMLGQDMSRGFSLVAWPADYGDTGIMTFTIGYDGQIFERDLGKETDKIARAMKSFDPDSAWKEVLDTPVSQR